MWPIGRRFVDFRGDDKFKRAVTEGGGRPRDGLVLGHVLVSFRPAGRPGSVETIGRFLGGDGGAFGRRVGLARRVDGVDGIALGPPGHVVKEVKEARESCRLDGRGREVALHGEPF